MEILFYLRWIVVFLFICTFILMIYLLYRYYICNNLASDVWNFFSKSNSFNGVMRDIVFRKKNNNQKISKLIILVYWLVGLFLCLSIWSVGYYEVNFI
ncbi:hypothetical protein EA769_08315 [Acinetobacter haemolyticus]|uniref:Uncharacterized protein n=1 Tax=Acinetobacter haemolyticus TaxID=29430 RepID=A0A429GQ37_ACIHA|nr:hypothetical protein AhaeAN59_06420 [Acinetobacter haemolyticus]QHI13021.1 hypothetical protein AhaeAN43_06350 [Acinetobacter haemolyticus]RSN76010.1 hypothetical protein EA769_08315 [Acinetobacter haemolyticus]